MKVPLALVVLLAIPTSGVAAVNVQPTGGKYYTSVAVTGAPSNKYDIVFIGDGFTSAQQATFNARVDDAVAALQSLAPYSERMCAFNIWRVNVVSSESGVDHPRDNIFRNTELDCRYGNPNNGEAERCIVSDSPAKCIEAANYAPDHDAIFVLVNDSQWGGCAGSVVTSSIATGFASIITHELGHKIAGLADEYDCFVCDGSDDNRTHPGPEPWAINLTRDTNRATTKWHGLIASTTPLPTTVNSPPGVVGLWQGGGYHRFGIFRPQLACQMRDLAAFCAVCAGGMRSALETRCTYCDLHPLNYICLWHGTRLLPRFLWDQRFRIRWPLPPCLTCPPDLFMDDIVYVLRGAPAEFKLYVYDDGGTVIAEGRATGEGLEARFRASRGGQYSVELVSGDAIPKRALALVSRMTRNGKLESER